MPELPGEYPAMTAPSRPTPATHRATRSPAVRRTLQLILVLNAIVVAIKLAVGIRTGALSVLGATLESALDMFNNVMGMILTGLAAREPDEDHPYGHEKFETLGALAIVGFLSISCFELLRAGTVQLFRGGEPHSAGILEIGLLVSTAVINVFVVVYETRRGRELSSGFLIADAEHTRSDIYITLLAIASLLFTRFGMGYMDPMLAIIVALLIARSGYLIVRETVPLLVDARAVDAESVREMVIAIPGIAGVRAVRSRASPSGVLYAELTIMVTGGTSVSDAHDLADEVEGRIADRFGPSEITVHVEPS